MLENKITGDDLIKMTFVAALSTFFALGTYCMVKCVQEENRKNKQEEKSQKINQVESTKTNGRWVVYLDDNQYKILQKALNAERQKQR